MRCQICNCYRSQLHSCVVCAVRLCGCCSIKSPKSPLNGKRVCCYPGDKGCADVNRRRAKGAA
jgi:hypothetical protein